MNNKGIELSINMLVVVILGIVILGVGISIFGNAFDKTQDLREEVSSQTQQNLNNLLDDGSIVVITNKNLEGERGKMSSFDIGITNINPSAEKFFVHVTYGGSSAYQDGDPFDPFDYMVTGDFYSSCSSVAGSDSSDCGDLWVRMPPKSRYFDLEANGRNFIPVGIVVPKDGNVLSGQYIFNVDICVGVNDCLPKVGSCSETHDCRISDESRYDARHIVIVTI